MVLILDVYSLSWHTRQPLGGDEEPCMLRAVFVSISHLNAHILIEVGLVEAKRVGRRVLYKACKEAGVYT